MRRTISALMVAAALTLLLAPAVCQAAEWTGWVTDSHCGAKGAKAEHASCAKKCLDDGAKLVFYNNADKKLYNLDNQDLAASNIGHEVTVKGELDGDTIKVASIDTTAAK
jgi:hypothetical protein